MTLSYVISYLFYQNLICWEKNSFYIKTFILVFNFTEEELENRTAINKALKRRWSTESTDSMKIKKAEQKIRRFSAFEAEGK